jgi:hypothetical protein
LQARLFNLELYPVLGLEGTHCIMPKNIEANAVASFVLSVIVSFFTGGGEKNILLLMALKCA